MIDRPWYDERYHDDSNFKVWNGEKRQGGRERLTATSCAHLRREKDPESPALAQKLSGCQKGAHCGSGGCPHCLTAMNRYRREVIGRAFPPNAKILMVTVIPGSPNTFPKKLEDIDIGVQHSILNYRLSSAGLSSLPLIGGLDLSLDMFHGRFNWEGWVPHWCLFTADCDLDTLRQVLRDAIPKSKLVVAPTHVQPVTYTPDHAFSYSYKIVFEERNTYLPKLGKRTIETNTIRSKHPRFCELLRGLDRIGLSERVFEQCISKSD